MKIKFAEECYEYHEILNRECYNFFITKSKALEGTLQFLISLTLCSSKEFIPQGGKKIQNSWKIIVFETRSAITCQHRFYYCISITFLINRKFGLLIRYDFFPSYGRFSARRISWFNWEFRNFVQGTF